MSPVPMTGPIYTAPKRKSLCSRPTSYALLLDAAHDVVPALGPTGPLPGDVGKGWAQAARGMAETAAGPVLVLDAHRLVAPLATAA